MCYYDYMKTNRLRLDPNPDQLQMLQAIGDRCSALWNAANYMCRQALFAGERIPSYSRLCSAFQSHEAYRALPSDIAQEVLKKLAEAWSSWQALRKRWKQAPRKDKPGLPRYRKDKDGARPTDFIPIKCGRAYRVNGRTIELTMPRDLSRTRLEIAYRGMRRYAGKMARAEIWYDAGRGRWYMTYAVQVADNAPKGWPRVAGIDLGIRVLASVSIEGLDTAFHFLGREVLKDWQYWTRRIAEHQRDLTHRGGRKSSRRLKWLYAKRRSRLQHAWDAMAARIMSLCRRYRVGQVVIGWPKGILDDVRLNRKWNGLTHGFWSFEQMSQRLVLALRRGGIMPERTGERGTSSHCPRCESANVIRRPRQMLRCRDCDLVVHSDHAGSFNIMSQRYPVIWDGAEAAPAPETHRFNLHRWADAQNPSIQVEDLAT